MCGINGIYDLKQVVSLENRVEKMNVSLAHRGPDAARVWMSEDGHLALGHRRLSIIDTNERSTQPMMSNSGRYIIVFNGEIYNYQELRNDTRYEYHTTSDTEVILAYTEQYGLEQFIRNANGMFAIAIYDTCENKLFLCRDRLGIKPLFYYIDDNVLVFSSEIKGILNSGLVKAELDEESIDDYFAYRYVREPFTLFKNIQQVESGTYLVIADDMAIECHRYWDVPDSMLMESHRSEDDILEEFGKEFERAVKLRLIADVPLGTYLSGGVDSSLLTAIAAKNKKDTLNTYTIGFPEWNEFPYSDMVAKKYDTTHHKILMDEKLYFSMLPEVVGYRDAPLGVPNEIALAHMSRVLKKKITVVLSGEGADELLGGYGRIFRSPFDYKNIDKKSEDRDFYDYFIDRYEYVPRYIRDNCNLSGNRRERFDRIVKARFKDNPCEYDVFWFFHKYHVKGLLQRVDTTTMLASVEARVPFLDHKLVEFSYGQVPYDMKLRWKSKEDKKRAIDYTQGSYSEVLDIPKYLLRKYSYRYLPAEVIERKKEGFPVPLKDWERHTVEKLKEYGIQPWMRGCTLDYLIQECKNLKIGYQILWMFLNMNMFTEKYFAKEWRW